MRKVLYGGWREKRHIHNSLDDGEQCDKKASGEQHDDMGQSTQDELNGRNRLVIEPNAVFAGPSLPGRFQPTC